MSAFIFCASVDFCYMDPLNILPCSILFYVHLHVPAHSYCTDTGVLMEFLMTAFDLFPNHLIYSRALSTSPQWSLLQTPYCVSMMLMHQLPTLEFRLSVLVSQNRPEKKKNSTPIILKLSNFEIKRKLT